MESINKLRTGKASGTFVRRKTVGAQTLYVRDGYALRVFELVGQEHVVDHTCAAPACKASVKASLTSHTRDRGCSNCTHGGTHDPQPTTRQQVRHLRPYRCSSKLLLRRKRNATSIPEWNLAPSLSNPLQLTNSRHAYRKRGLYAHAPCALVRSHRFQIHLTFQASSPRPS